MLKNFIMRFLINLFKTISKELDGFVKAMVCF